MTYGQITPLSASEWLVLLEDSTLGFSVDVQGKPLAGRFSKFNADVNFDPEKPEDGTIEVIIDLASLLTGDAQTGMSARSAPWLAAREFRFAKLTTAAIQRTSGDRFSARANLSIKNVAIPVTLEFTVTIADEKAHAAGTLDLNRLQFGIGPPASDMTPVDETVTVTFSVVAEKKN